MKKKFKDFMIEDLTGGLNLKDAPNEIDNKQSLECHNFSFKGDRLTNGKKEKNSGLNIIGKINGFTNDNGDVFYFSDELYNKNGLRKGLKSIGIGVIGDKFKSGYNFTIIIDGNKFEVKGDSVKELLLNLYNKIDGDKYEKQMQDDLIIIGRKDGLEISYEGTEDRKKVLYNFNSSDKQSGELVFYNFTLDGREYSGSYKNPNGLNQGQEDIYLINQIKNTIGRGEVVNIDTNGNITPKYQKYAGLIIDGASSFEPSNKMLNFYCIRNYSNETGGFEGFVRALIGGKTGIIVEGREILVNRAYYMNTMGGYARITIEVDGVAQEIVSNDRWNGSVNFGPNVATYTSSRYDAENSSWLFFGKKDGRKLNIKVNGRVVDLDNISGDYKYEYGGGGTLTIGYHSGAGSSSSVKYEKQKIINYIPKGDGTFKAEEEIREVPVYSSYDSNVLYGLSKSNNIRDIIIQQLRGWGYNCEEGTIDGKNYGIWFWKNDYSEINITLKGDINGVYAESGSLGPFSSGYKYPQIYKIRDKIGYSRKPEDIRVLDYTSSFKINKLNGNNLLNNGIKRLSVGNKDGTLIVDKFNGGATYNYNGIVADLGESSVGKPTVGTLYNGKIILGGYKNTDNIVFSKTSEPRHPFDLLRFGEYDAGAQSVSSGDKGEVVGFSVGENGLYVFKNNSVWYSNQEQNNASSKSFNFIFRKITSNGALNQETITEVGQEIFYLDWESRMVRRLGYEQNMQTLRDTGIGKEIKELLEALPNEQPLATAHFKYPNYHLSLTDGKNKLVEIGGRSYHPNNKHFVYNVENNAWSTMDCVDIIFSHKGKIVGRDNKVYDTFVENMESGYFLSKEYTFGNDNLMKKFGKFEISGRISGNKELTIKIIIDGEEIEYKKFIANGENRKIREKIDLYDIGETFQFKLEYTGSGELEIYDVNIKFKGTGIEIDDYN